MIPLRAKEVKCGAAFVPRPSMEVATFVWAFGPRRLGRSDVQRSESAERVYSSDLIQSRPERYCTKYLLQLLWGA